MPDTTQIKTRIEAAQTELAKAQEELARAEAQPKYDAASLYLIQESNWTYVSYGRDMGTDERGRVLSSRFVTVGHNIDGRVTQTFCVRPYTGPKLSFAEGSTVVRLHKGDF